MTISRLEELKLLLNENKIDSETVKNEIFSSKTKSWHNKEWCERKEIFLKTACEQCGNTQDLIVQHMWHPDVYGKFVYNACILFYEKFRKEHPMEDLIQDNDVLIYIESIEKRILSVCPNCGYQVLQIRKNKLPKYRCARCHFECEEPQVVNYPVLIDDRNNYQNDHKPYELSFERTKFYLYEKQSIEAAKIFYRNEIDQMALIAYIDENIRYLNFNGAVTWCKRCAFNFDRNHADLCPKCKKNYKKIGYKICRECSGKTPFTKIIERTFGNCRWNWGVCVAGVEKGPYQYGDTIVNDTCTCTNWEGDSC